MYINLFLQQIVDDLLTIEPVSAIADMHPVRTFSIMLPDELIVW